MLCKIDDLPDEILEYILSLVPPYKDLHKCMLVSKRWYRATKNVVDHNDAHFQKAVASGTLFWKIYPGAEWSPTIGKRHSHSACTYENSMYVFGGCTATCTTFNDLWRLDLDTKKWVRPITMGSYPSPKACATMLYYKKNFILFGGWSHPSPYPLHQYISTLVQETDFLLVGTFLPKQSEGEKFTRGGNQVLVQMMNHIFRHDVRVALFQHASICATYAESSLAHGVLKMQWKLFNELHVYSIEMNRWSAINALESPPPTSAHSASIHENLMVVFGGVCNGYSSNEVWCLNLDTYCWHEQTTSNSKPQPRYGQSQIELDSKHLLILGGCTGPNVAMNDAWLLTMEGTSWTWRKVNMVNSEWAPTRIWCHQACKVGQYIVVLSRNKQLSTSYDMSISLGKNACQRPAPTEPMEPIPPIDRQKEAPRIDRDENVNGRRGSFARATVQNNQPPSSSTSSAQKNVPYQPENNMGMAAFREETMRSRHAANRQRQLELLRRMEERIANRRIQSKVVKKTENTLAIFVLDIARVLSEDCVASWIPLKQNNQSGPDERILYSLVLGRSELIVFGGIRKEQTTIQGQTETDDSEVYNDLHFINPPRYVI